MLKWVKKMFREKAKEPQHQTTMVEVLRELWDINEKKEKEPAPPDVNHDIYHVEPRDKRIPRRNSRGRQRYKRS